MALPVFEPDHVWTVADLDLLPDDGNRYELVDGALHVSPGPTWRHSTVSSRLARQLEDACPAGLLVVVPAGGLLIPRQRVWTRRARCAGRVVGCLRRHSAWRRRAGQAGPLGRRHPFLAQPLAVDVEHARRHGKERRAYARPDRCRNVSNE